MSGGGGGRRRAAQRLEAVIAAGSRLRAAVRALLVARASDADFDRTSAPLWAAVVSACDDAIRAGL